jgi:hypothetical protein
MSGSSVVLQCLYKEGNWHRREKSASGIHIVEIEKQNKSNMQAGRRMNF